MRSRFRLPGPTPLPPAVFAAMQRPMIPHRSDEFKHLYRSILERTKSVHRTSGDIFMWAATGSAGWEAAIVNLFSPGDTVVCAITGDFGERFYSAAVALGLDARRLETPWGQATDPDALREALRAAPDAAGVFLTHNETSTGITNPLPELAAIAREAGALVVVDAVSSAAGLPLLPDEWGLDFVLSGSQKAWMCPPGLLICAVGERCWPAYERSGYPRFFWDFATMREAAAQGMTPTTPPLTVLYALDAALDLILAEGVEQVWARHAALGAQTRAGIERLGLRLFADPAHASNTITAVAMPEGVSARAVIARLRDEHGIDVASGQAHTADRMIRIGHMGWCDQEDIDLALGALGEVLTGMGVQPGVVRA